MKIHGLASQPWILAGKQSALLTRIPTITWGNAAGQMTLRYSFQRGTQKFSAACRNRGSMPCTPVAVCTTIGKTDEMKMRKIGDASPIPNQRIAIGIQAMGEIGRRI